MPKLNNAKREKFIQKMADPANLKSKADTYRQVYNCSETSAHVGSTNLLKNPECKERLTELLNKQGLSLDYLNSKLKDLVNAKKEVYSKNGELIAKVDDNNIQLSAIKTGYQLHNVLKADNTINIDKSSNQINILSTDVDVNPIDILQELRELSQNLSIPTGGQSGEVIDTTANK